MTKEELRELAREVIAKELCRQMGEDAWETLPLKRPKGKASYLGIYKQQFYDLAEPILNLPELAPYFRDGYVKLDEDQSLPTLYQPNFEEHIDLAIDRVKHYKQAQQDMLLAGFKKVVEDG